MSAESGRMGDGETEFLNAYYYLSEPLTLAGNS